MRLSIVIPVYNERRTLGHSGCRRSRVTHVSKEIVVVDDCSTDGTREWLKANFPDGARSGSSVDLDNDGQLTFAQGPGLSNVTIRPIFHERNTGKEAGCRPDSPPSKETSW